MSDFEVEELYVMKSAIHYALTIMNEEYSFNDKWEEDRIAWYKYRMSDCALLTSKLGKMIDEIEGVENV
jgi:hypothetical protein